MKRHEVEKLRDSVPQPDNGTEPVTITKAQLRGLVESWFEYVPSMWFAFIVGACISAFVTSMIWSAATHH